MKVGDLIVNNTIIATNSVTASNVIDRFNIRWWGADPTGVADSTTAISNALAYVGSGRLYVPKGTYRIITIYINNSFLTLTGDGPGGSTFHSSNAAPMFVISGANSIIENINLQGNGIATYGIHLTNSEQSVIRDVVIDKIIGPGIFAQESFSLLFDRCRVIQSHIGIHLTNNFQNSRIDHCLIYFNTNYNVLLGKVGTPSVNVSMKDTELESMGQAATNLLVNDVSSLVLDGVYFESTEAAGKDIVVDGTTSLVGINGMYANGNGVSTNSIFCTGANSVISLKNSFFVNYTTAPFVSQAKSSVENSSINGIYYSMDFNSAVSASAGSGTSNVWVGGRVYSDFLAHTNHTGTDNYTNLVSFTIPAHTLTNNGDQLSFKMAGDFRGATATTNSFKMQLGVSAAMETGFVTASNCTWEAYLYVVRTATSVQRVNCNILWSTNLPPGQRNSGPLVITATNMTLALDTGITNIFVFQGKSRVLSGITNNWFTVDWTPGPR